MPSRSSFRAVVDTLCASFRHRLGGLSSPGVGGRLVVGIAIVLALAMTGIPLEAEAQEAPPSPASEAREGRPGEPASPQWSVRVGGGAALPLAPAPFAEDYHPGAAVDVQGRRAVGDRLWIELGAQLHRFAPSDAGALVQAQPGVPVRGLELSSVTGAVGVRYVLPVSTRVQPYAALRGGGAWTHVADARVDLLGRTVRVDGSSELSPWTGGGLGVLVGLTPRMSLFVEPSAEALWTRADPTLRLSAQIGVTYAW